MKFLLALTILASTAAFAQENRKAIFCYEPAEQGGHGEVAFLLEQRGEGPNLHIYYPYDIVGGPLMFNEETGCLRQPGGSPGILVPRLELCPTDGQHIDGLIPFEASFGNDEETVYCDKKIKRFLRETTDGTKTLL